MQALLLRGGHQKVIDAVGVGDGTMARAASEQHALGACVESLQGAHVISTGAASPRSTAGICLSRLSSSTDCTPQQFGSWSSCHGSYPALWPFPTKVWGVVTALFTA
jgi:hypothetical protein